ncbi:MAG: hypothetical protein ACR2RV_20420, partial [Verrucomicrobiales bacterium]
PARRQAARTRSRTALAAPRPARTAAASKRLSIRSARGITVRAQLRPRCSTIFSNSWWGARRPLWRHHWHYHNRYPWWYWWSWASWSDVDDWVDDSDWDEGWDYEYDDNVVFDDEVVFINDEAVATAEDYVEIAEELAAISEPGEDDEIEWLSLGVFAMSASDTEINPPMMIQLVLAKDGRVGGTYYHINTETAREVRGSLDEETQRIAFVIGEESNDVIEVGLDNLTRGECPLWVHFENGTQTQTWTLIRLDPPEEAVAEKKAAGEQ